MSSPASQSDGAGIAGPVEPGRRPPPGHLRFPLLDGVRAIAALSVVGVHIADTSGFSAHGIPGALAARLNVGVAVFFVLSGFLLYRPFVAARLADRPAPGLARYARRRVLRIIPAYWTALALCAVLGWVDLGGGWWRYAFFGQTADRLTILGGIPPAWTLVVEVSFYATLPLWALAMGRLLTRGRIRRRVRVEALALGVAAAASLVLRYVIAREDPWSLWLVNLPGFLLWFAGGMGLALLSLQVERHGIGDGPLAVIARRPAIPWTVALVAYVLACFALGLPHGLEQPTALPGLGQHVAFFVVAVCVTAPAVLAAHRGAMPGSPALVERLLGHRIVTWLGLVSYGVFLWNAPLISWLVTDVEITERVPAPMVVLTLLAVTGAIALGAASYYLVERPFLRLKERRRAAGPARERPSAG